MIPDSGSLSIPITFEPSLAFYDLMAKLKPSPFIFDVIVDSTIVVKAVRDIKRKMKGHTTPLRMDAVDSDTNESIGIINVSGIRVNGKMIWTALETT